jgi:hypothetical protein
LVISISIDVLLILSFWLRAAALVNFLFFVDDLDGDGFQLDLI